VIPYNAGKVGQVTVNRRGRNVLELVEAIKSVVAQFSLVIFFILCVRIHLRQVFCVSWLMVYLL